MKKVTLSEIAVVLVAFFGIIQFGSASAFARSTAVAQSGQTQQTQQQKIPGNSPANAALRNTSQVFWGTISKQNGKYVLTAGGFTYKLNQQSKLKKYDGKQVQITGKLNPKTNKIHIIRVKKPSY